MPFTIAHAAAILPFRWQSLVRLSLAGLVLGSFTPDAGYVLGGNCARFSHSFRGSFYFDIPMGFFLYLVFRAIRKPLTDLLPNPHFSALERAGSACPINPLLVIASLWIGSATHIIWDSFTHTDGWVTLRLPALREVVIIFGRPLPLCRLLQFVSSGLGLIVLAVSYRRWLARQKISTPRFSPDDLPRYALWLTIFGLPTVCLTLHNYLLMKQSRGSMGLAHFGYKNIAELLGTIILIGVFAALMHQIFPLVPTRAAEKSPVPQEKPD